MKTHKAPRKPGMHSLHDQKGSSAKAMHTGGLSTKTLVIIGAVTVVVLLLMYFSMVA
jgi:hypothetical protein